MTPQRAIQLALFATGVSGIVAEYLLSTLATYFIGNGLVQWSLIISLMLFAMGLGARFSGHISSQLLQAFIYTELSLSLLVSVSAITAYLAQPFPPLDLLSIYIPAIVIGIMIGMEIPLALRLNEQYTGLRENAASLLEKDYWGSLLGGILFAFVALPFLGMSWTPLVFGLVNFSVALVMMWYWRREVSTHHWLLALLVALIFLLLAWKTSPLIIYGEQLKYRDQIVLSEQTRHQKLVVTRWKNDYWFFINGQVQFSTFDEHLYHEPLIHPAMSLTRKRPEVLVMGGGDGLAVRELLKWPVQSVTLVDLDPEVTRLALENPLFLEINQSALHDDRVEIVNRDAFNWLDKSDRQYDLIVADFPDPESADLARLYSVEFYRLVYHHLRDHGVFVTQATSPRFTENAFLCIGTTLQAAGFAIYPSHNYVPSLGEWGWYLGLKDSLSRDQLLERLQQAQLPRSLRYYNIEAASHLFSFGQEPDFQRASSVNTMVKPVLERLYRNGEWGFSD